MVTGMMDLDLVEIGLAERKESGVQRSNGGKPIGVQKLRDRHHALARALAAGMPDYEAAIVAGYSISRVSILKNDPAFSDLVEHYRQQITLAVADHAERLMGVGAKAIGQLEDVLDKNAEALESGEDPLLSPMQLLDIGTKMADRTGYGPQTVSKNVNVNVNLAGRLESARKRVGAVLPAPRPSHE